jgi:hypothetical protein
MSSAADTVLIDVACPDCADLFVVPLSVIEESQRLLADFGPCTGFASFECPVAYFAALLAPCDVSRLARGVADERELDRWENEGGSVRP